VLVKQGWATKQLFDQRKQTLDGANAGLAAAEARVTEAQHGLNTATHDVELYKVNIADNTLVAPRDGRIEYRIANTGEVLSARADAIRSGLPGMSYVRTDANVAWRERLQGKS
jgi:HlyD family secretion protein